MDAVIAVDDDQRIVVFNAAAEKMFGCPEQDAIGTLLDRFIPERFRTAHRAHLRQFGQSEVANREMGWTRVLVECALVARSFLSKPPYPVHWLEGNKYLRL